MKVGILPAPGSGLATMAKTGQIARLWRHLGYYAEAGFDLRYFSYLDHFRDEWDHFTKRPDWRAPRDLNCRPGGTRRAFLRPLVEARRWRDLSVCHAMNLLGAIPALTAKWAFGVPFVISHGADYEAIARVHGRSPMHVRKWGWLRRLVFRSASAVLVSNEALARRLGQRFPKANIINLPNWVDTEMFCPAGKPEAGRVLYVGRLVEEKNLLRLEEAVAGIFGAHLRCIGEGPFRWALSHGTRGADCPGPIPWERLPEEYRAARCFVLPSLTEGHPKALLEAMACGVPVAVSDRVEGVVRHEETGLVFGAEDVAGMRKQIARLLDDDDLAAELGTAARREALARWDAKALMPREIEIVRGAAK